MGNICLFFQNTLLIYYIVPKWSFSLNNLQLNHSYNIYAHLSNYF